MQLGGNWLFLCICGLRRLQSRYFEKYLWRKVFSENSGRVLLRHRLSRWKSRTCALRLFIRIFHSFSVSVFACSTPSRRDSFWMKSVFILETLIGKPENPQGTLQSWFESGSKSGTTDFFAARQMILAHMRRFQLEDGSKRPTTSYATFLTKSNCFTWWWIPATKECQKQILCGDLKIPAKSVI